MITSTFVSNIIELVRKGEYFAALKMIQERFHCQEEAAIEVMDEYLLQEMPIALSI